MIKSVVHYVLMHHDHIARAEARMLADLVVAGRQAAALDGRHLLAWGLLAATVLGIQYLAETQDWLPSRVLWMWQPLALAGFVASIFVARTGAGRRLGNPVSRRYAIAFAAAGCAVALYLITAGADQVPDGITTVMLLCGAFGGAFLLLASTTQLRWMLLPAAGWWTLMSYYLTVGRIEPLDWLRLSVAFFLLVALPGAALVLKKQT